MRLAAIILYSFVMILSLVSCKWRDDFRERKQPYYLEYEPQPTFNMDSEQYVGDEVVDEATGEAPPPKTNLPEIDGRSQLPDIPEHPEPY